MCSIMEHNTVIQEAQLPQRNSASAAHMDGGGGFGPPAHSPSTPLVIPVHMVESESHNVRTSSVLSVKRTLR